MLLWYVNFICKNFLFDWRHVSVIIFTFYLFFWDITPMLNIHWKNLGKRNFNIHFKTYYFKCVFLILMFKIQMHIKCSFCLNLALLFWYGNNWVLIWGLHILTNFDQVVHYVGKEIMIDCTKMTPIFNKRICLGH